MSAYHHFFSEPFGQETRPTHYPRGNENSGFHLDYCFIPAEWVEHLSNVEVGLHRDWYRVSDHVPVIVDVDMWGRSAAKQALAGDPGPSVFSTLVVS